MSKSKYLVSLAALPLAVGCTTSPESISVPSEQRVENATTVPAQLNAQVCHRLKNLVFNYGYPDQGPVINFFGETNADGTVSMYGEDISFEIIDTAKRVERATDTLEFVAPEMNATLSTIIENSKQVRSLADKVIRNVPRDEDGYPRIERAPGSRQLDSLAEETRRLTIHTVRDNCANPNIG